MKPDGTDNRASHSSPTEATPPSTAAPSLQGVRGWLLFFVIGLGIAGVYNLVQLASYPGAFKELESAAPESLAFVNDLRPILQFEVLQFALAIAVIVTLIVLIIKQKRIAKPIAIGLLIGIIITGTIDYFWASAVFAEHNLNVQTELQKAAGMVGRSVVAAAIWIPYFLVSKRVKQTLTK